ncbi:glycoside hydrolase family 3 N-terminal domain-containing protein [Halobium palmae]|uniref:beta-glucosidase n=1 Tax=Halobium palmae TaxID=1776492 RepID=A0ABD5RY75_9EURY
MSSDPPYLDATEPIEARVSDLLGRMTLQEKVGQLTGMHAGSFLDTRRKHTQTTTVSDVKEAVREHYIGSVTPFGTGLSQYNNVIVAARIANRLQRVAVEETRLGVPLLVPVDAIHGHAHIEGSTVFPHNLGMGATWDADLVERAARVTATEMAATGANQNYSPTADVSRDPRWGRNYETYGESPRLVSDLVAAETQGLQGETLADSDAVAATVKHYPASSAPVRGEDTAPVDVSSGTLRRVFLPPFERAIEEGVAALMPMYNALGNEPIHGSKYYLTDLLRTELGYDGVVCSDWLGLWMLAERHRVASSLSEATYQAVDAGLDIASVGGPEHAERLTELVETGRIAESKIDENVARVLRLKFALGLFDDPYVSPDIAVETVGSDAHRRTSLECARKSITLLENDDDTLPLTDPDSLFVTGPNADTLDGLVGGWTVLGLTGSSGTTIREGLSRGIGGDASVTCEPVPAGEESPDLDRVEEAAADADAAVVAVGEAWYLHEFGPESVVGPTDAFPKRNQLRLPSDQRELVDVVSGTGTPTIVVVVTGRPLVLTDVVERTDALLVAFFPGTTGGDAIADVLLGEVNPSGRLPVSFPRSIGDLPVTHDWLPHPSPLGGNEHLPSYDPLFDFGYGLSYTSFSYDSLDVSDETVSPGDDVTVEVTVTNTGERPGEETVQLFGQNLVSSYVTPVRELKAFAKLELDPGETKRAEFTLRPRDFSVVHPDGQYATEPGEFELYVDDHSRILTVEE